MKHQLALGVALVALVSCTSQQQGVPAKSSGSIGITHDDLLLYVADADHDRVTVVNARSREVVGHVPVGAHPERVLVGPDDAVYVSNRGSRSVTRLAPGSTQVESTGTVGAEPVGMALSPDGQRLYVANSMSGTVSVLDPKTLQAQAELKVGGEPYSLAVLPDGKSAYITDFSGGNLQVLDLRTGTITSRVNLAQPPGAECRFGTAPPRTPAQPADVVVSPDGERAYVAHVQSRTGSGGVQTSMALAVAPALSTVGTHRNALMQEPVGDEAEADFPASILATNLDQTCQNVDRGAGMDAPSSLVVDGSGEWIFVADHNSNAVAVVSAVRHHSGEYRVPERGIYDVVRVGARPTGIAVTGDLRTAYVHNALDYTISVVENRDRHLIETGTISFANPTLPAEVERGRKLFYSAVDPRVTQPELGGVSCSSCHPDGRSDSLSWNLPPERGSTNWTNRGSPRNTQPLWGVLDTAPYHWDGLLADMPSFSHVMVSQMGGRGLSGLELGDLTSYLATLSPPDNPNLETRPFEQLAEGGQLFAANCAGCHFGANLSDRTSHALTLGEDIDTPSLRGVFATPPYLHDGSARTLRGVFTGPMPSLKEHDLRGKLGESQAQALEAYLQTL
ncbi:MAG: c-type cytochrome [Myxococcaceae bacterium]